VSAYWVSRQRATPFLVRFESLNFKFGRDETMDRGSIVIQEHVLNFLLAMDHSYEADNPVPRFVSNLVVHTIDMHVDHLEDVVTELDIQKSIWERSFDMS
nr:Mg2+ transporter protein, CorA-like/zinc transport protein ZntB [Tanacetum cinerariifolium]